MSEALHDVKFLLLADVWIFLGTFMHQPEPQSLPDAAEGAEDVENHFPAEFLCDYSTC